MNPYKLKAAMDNIGVSVEELAALLKLSAGTVYKKRRENSFFLREAFDILDYLNMKGGSYGFEELFR